MTGGAMSSSPVVSSTKAGSPDAGGTAVSTSKALPDEGNAVAEGSPNTGGSASIPTPVAGVSSKGEAVGTDGDVVGATKSMPAMAA